MSVPSSGFERGLGFAGRHAGKLSVLTFFLGLLWFLSFPLVCVTTGELKCRGTYLSENALLAGAHEIALRKDANSHSRNIEKLGNALEVSETFEKSLLLELNTIPFVKTYNHSSSGILYSVLKPSPGGDRKEAVIICTSLEKGNSMFISAAITQLRVLSGVKWLSKNVYLILTPNHMALQEWLNDYYERAGADIHRAGMLIGAIVYEKGVWEGTNRNALSYIGHGINGQLPNLDLINVAVRVPPRGISPGINRPRADAISKAKGFLKEKLPEAVKEVPNFDWYLNHLETLLQFAHRASFGPTGLHGMFLSKGIDAITMIWDQGDQNQEAIYLDIVSVGESVLHSLSNLSEKLHQSFYLYMLPSPHHFVSIEEYNWTLILILCPFAFSALRTVYGVGSSTDSIKVSGGTIIGTLIISSYALCVGLIMLFLSTDNGAQVVANLPTMELLFTYVERNDLMAMIPRKLMVWWGAYVSLMVLTLSIVLPSLLSIIKDYSGEKSQYWEALKLAILYSLYVSHAMLGMISFPFAFLSALVCVPVYYNLKPRSIVSAVLLFGTLLPMQLFILRQLVVDDRYWKGSGGHDTLMTVQALETLEHKTGNSIVSSLFESLGILMTGFNTIGALHLPYLCVIHIPAHIIGFGVLFVG